MILPRFTLCDTPPVNPTPEGADQVYVVPVGIIPSCPFEGVNTKSTPLHVVAVNELTVASGLIVTVTVNVEPIQTPDNGVIV